LKRPGHDECMTCHQDAFGANLNPKICAQCHTQFPPTGDDLYPFPRYQKKRLIVFQFSHALHVDPQGRIDARTGFRADCTFCHHFDAKGDYATFPSHPQCAACHAKPGMKPQLSANSTTADCRGCHIPEEIENPGFAERRFIAPHVVSGKYVNLRFTHLAHFKFREQYHLNCTTCHYAIPHSTSLETLELPKMIDCVECHDTSKVLPAQFRMTNCQTCHIDPESGAAPASHTRYVKPAFHTASFRLHHTDEASAPGAKCFVCHTNVSPTATGGQQCISCHEVMLPASHTARWKDDLHGKYAALDRESCALCHQADSCTRCHNQLPRSHVPLAAFKAGAHARLAMLDERACLTCHTFENTCAECHTRSLQ
jgi:Cytochrome c7 and related cytochrome c